MYKTAVIVIEKYSVRHNLLVTLIRLELTKLTSHRGLHRE